MMWLMIDSSARPTSRLRSCEWKFFVECSPLFSGPTQLWCVASQSAHFLELMRLRADSRFERLIEARSQRRRPMYARRPKQNPEAARREGQPAERLGRQAAE